MQIYLPIEKSITVGTFYINRSIVKKGREKSLIDLWIAVSAYYYDLKLLTLDKDFEDISEAIKIDLEIIE